ncbi:DEAD/DEAH box helicase [uncultured Clostridium sp.]|uniref:DEAD/DEAH box helicase n=1 Tax=uncultured Clostridium sp. TaxID=59620 RepID=UPI0025CDE2DD|nr:SNF2 helicase associated domain-containing protein [uncultured Clostridium sp.]
MIKQILIEKFNKNLTSSVMKKADDVIKNDLIKDLITSTDDEIINIKSIVISESLLSEYNCKIIFDIKSMDIIGTYCSCSDYEKNEFKKDNYCCKHIAASFYEFIDDALQNESMSALLNKKCEEKKEDSMYENEILKSLLDDKKNTLKLEVILSKNHWSSKLQAEFKIGLRNQKMYVIKDLNHFLVSLFNNIPIKYGKDFTFDIKKQKFSYEDNRLIKFICNLQKFDDNNRNIRRQDKIIDGKFLTIPAMLIKDFLSIVKKNRVMLGDGFFYRIIECDVIEGDIPICFSLKSVSEGITLEIPDVIPESLSDNDDVFLFGTSLYIPSIEQCERIEPYLRLFSKTKKITFSKNDEEIVLRELIPNLQKISSYLDLSPNIRSKIISGPVNFRFYFDKDDGNVSLLFKVSYEGYEFNFFDEYKDKIIYRDTQKENEVYALLKSLGFSEVNEKLYLLRDDDEIFKFFKYEIEKLQRYGEVFYSERFKGIKNIKKSDFKGQIHKGKYDYFELKFKLSNITEEEVIKILRNFRNNLKYYKLENGEYLDLEQEALKETLKLLDNLILENSMAAKDTVLIPVNKGAYVEDYIEDKKFRYIKTCEEMKELKERLHNIESKIFQPPYGLMAKLRNYQKQGYNWMRTLDYLGFGGILADEMGLGKTLQTITLILSRPNTKTLITAPTSLIYNWLSEFKKFAPSIKVLVCNGIPEERRNNIKNYKDYDVIITTYSMLRNDLEYYTMNFDYFILDEAQNIKNSNSLNSKCVKKIKSRIRFALTGTPIENSLMELWSIFDFIMPGYLYDENRFTTRYFRRLEEDKEILEEVHKMVSPFILRRLKKNVMMELPDKIEKIISIPLENEQKTIYQTYAKYAKDIIEKKVESNELKKSRIEILSYITKLRQICLDPSVVMDNYNGRSSKIDTLIDILAESVKGGHKVLVFSQFTSVLKNIGKILKEVNQPYCYLDGTLSSSERIKIVNEFNESDKNIFLISLKAGGTGLNLTSADIVIHFDPWWNPAVEDQATDRAHRIGQKNSVEVIKLISKDTVEEKILDLQNSKKELTDKILSENLDSYSLNTLDDNEILQLFN